MLFTVLPISSVIAANTVLGENRALLLQTFKVIINLFERCEQIKATFFNRFEDLKMNQLLHMICISKFSNGRPNKKAFNYNIGEEHAASISPSNKENILIRSFYGFFFKMRQNISNYLYSL